jgi:hypothetical protein
MKMLKFKILLLFFISLFYSFQTFCQVSCQASAPSQVSIGQSFRYSIVLNKKPSSYTPFKSNDFSVLNGPSQSSSSSYSFINGQQSSSISITYSYDLQANKKGNFVIPAQKFVVEGKEISSNSVSVTVVEGQPQQQGNRQNQSSSTQAATANSVALTENDLMIKAEVSNSNPYMGEEVIVTHKLYVSNKINGGFSIEKMNLPTQTGLWSYQMGDPNAEAKRNNTTIDGKPYTVYEIRKTAVFPQKSGEIQISPFEMKIKARVIYQVRTNDPWEAFFGGGQRSQDYLLDKKSNVIKLNVKNLPANNRPDNFDDLVGNFTVKAHLSRFELKANDATNLTITITGTGNLQHIEPPKIAFPTDFDVTDPKVLDKINTSGSTVNGLRTFEYVIVPRTEGEFVIPAASFSFFNKATQSYQTITTEDFFIKVNKDEGGNVNQIVSSNQKDIKYLDKDIRFIKTSGRAFHPVRGNIFMSGWYFCFLLLPLILFFIFMLIRYKHIENNKDIAVVKDRKANRVARKRLKKAEELSHKNNTEDFYEEIARVLWGYISDKFHIPLSQLSMDTFKAKLSEKSVNENLIEELSKTLQQCEFARFAPGNAEENMKDMYKQTAAFITKMEKK